MYPFTYLRAADTDEAVALLARHPESRPLSGGMTLVPTLKQRLASPTHLVDLSRIAALHGIARSEDRLRIGAATPHAVVAGSAAVRESVPALSDLAGLIGDPQVRSRGTLGGSVANSDPGADYPSAVLALDGCIETDRRTIAADLYFRGLFETALVPGEVITAIAFAVPRRAVYLKHRHPASGYAIVGVFVAEHANGWRVGVTGAGACAFRWTEAEQWLDRQGHRAELADVPRLPAQGLNADLAATPEYRAHLAHTLLRRAAAAWA